MSPQVASVYTGSIGVSLELPPADAEVVPGGRWGAVEAFPTPAYWAYQVFARRLENRVVRYKLGSTLREELGACLLGGHGIPAKVGVGAFRHLRSKGAFEGAPSEACLLAWLSEPLDVEGRAVRYRFAGQKAKYLAGTLAALNEGELRGLSGVQLRNRLVGLPGGGYKTASWVARNWLDADDVAILDIHILRAGVIAGFLDSDLTVERHYLELEQQFLRFSTGLGVRASELDALIWLEMMSAPRSVSSVLSALPDSRFKSRHAPLKRRANNGHADAMQLALLVQ